MIRPTTPLLIACFIILQSLAGAAIASSHGDKAIAPCPGRGSLGIVVEKLEQAIAAQLGLQPGRGAIITRVLRGRAGHKAGLEQFDVITHLDGKRVTASNLLSRIRSRKVGTKVTLDVIRRMKSLKLVAVLDKDVPIPRARRKTIVSKRPQSSERRRRSGCMTPPDAFSSEISRMQKLARQCDSKARGFESQLKSLGSQEKEYERELRDLERRLARERAEIERKIARLESSIARKRTSLEKRRESLVAERKKLEDGREQALAERLLVESRQKSILEKRNEVERKKNAPTKRREIL